MKSTGRLNEEEENVPRSSPAKLVTLTERIGILSPTPGYFLEDGVESLSLPQAEKHIASVKTAVQSTA